MSDELVPQFRPAEAGPEPWRVLDPSGTLVAGREAPMPDDDVLAALRLMRLSRAFDAKAFSLQRQGRFGTFSPVRGQEASVVGCASALDPARDWVVPQYRELPALLRQGFPLEHFALYFMGNPAGGEIPPGVNVLPIQISLAAQLPHAVGLGWGLRLRGSDGVATVFFGDGASSEGDTHEAMNLAGVLGAPVVFVLQNNGWAISTPRSRQNKGATFAERAPAYGFPGVVVDGNDLFAVHQAMAQAVDRARRGDGPTLIESLTYRMGPHNTADDPTRYADDAVAQSWAALDPIDRVERYLESRGRWSDTAREAMDAELAAEIEGALERARERHQPGPHQLFDHVFAEDTPRVQEERAELLTGERA